MSSDCYPVFEPGQTLTAEDLNDLRDFLDEQDRLTRRLVGFGVVCGLDGSISGGTLTISHGLAIDQPGNGLLVGDPVTLSVAAAADPRTFDFIDPGAGGRTAVLVMESTEQPAPACSEADCEGHAGVICREPAVVLVDGRLDSGELAFAAEPLLEQEPVRVSQTGAVHGAFAGLKSALTTRWTEAGITLSSDATAVMTALGIETGELAGVKALKAAFLNQVLFATLDLLRCRALHGGACLRSADPAGVALGWIDTSGTSPTWDCTYRHHFSPPSGMASALLGGSCQDPCALYLQRLDALVANFRVPETPAPEEPPSGGGGGYHVCPSWKVRDKYKGVREYLRYIDCPIYEVPPLIIDEHWRDKYRIFEEERFLNPQDLWTDPPPTDPWILYGDEPLDFTDAGVITLFDALGRDAGAVHDVLEEVMGEHRVTPDLRIVTMSEVGDLDGFEHKASVSLGDTVVLVSDEMGKVVSTGRVSNAQTVRVANTRISEATEISNQAAGQAASAAASVEGFDGRLGGAEESITAFQTFQSQTLEWQSEVAPVIGGIQTSVQTAVDAAMAGVQRGVNDAVAGAMAHERGRWLDEAEARFSTKLTETRDAIDDRIDGIAQQTAGIQTEVGIVKERTAGTEGRIDDLFKVQAGGRAARAFTGPEVNTSLVTFLGAMRSSLEAATAGRRGAPAVREALAAGDEALATLESRASAAAGLAESAPQELARVVESFVDAAGKAGVPQADVQRLGRDANALIERLGR